MLFFVFSGYFAAFLLAFLGNENVIVLVCKQVDQCAGLRQDEKYPQVSRKHSLTKPSWVLQFVTKPQQAAYPMSVEADRGRNSGDARRE